MRANRVALLFLLGVALSAVSQAQIQSVEMRVEGMT